MERNKMRVYVLDQDNGETNYVLLTKNSDVCYFYLMNARAKYGIEPMVPKLMFKSAKGVDFNSFARSVLDTYNIADRARWISNDEFFSVFD